MSQMMGNCGCAYVDFGVCSWCRAEIAREFPGRPILVNQGPPSGPTLHEMDLDDARHELTPHIKE